MRPSRTKNIKSVARVPPPPAHVDARIEFVGMEWVCDFRRNDLELVAQTFLSWNQIGIILRRLEAL